jgi:uncharacterized protein (DUF2236 family)
MMVSDADFERRLEELCARAAPGESLFGPDSVTWQVNREAACFLGAGRALLLQLAHPWVAAGIAGQSQVFTDPLGRFHRTFNIVFTMVFGTSEQATSVARRLYRRHATVDGVLPEAVGAFTAGSRYCANEVNALRWVHATLADTALLAHDLLLPPLSEATRERYWAETRSRAALFGIPEDALAPDWAAFQIYLSAMVDSNVITVSPGARDIAQRIFSGAATRVGPPRWYCAVTAQLLPERLRVAFELPFGDAERRQAARALGWLRRTYPLLPKRLRTVGPYQEACARIKGGQGPGFATRLLNRAWIGQPSMGRPATVARSAKGAGSCR